MADIEADGTIWMPMRAEGPDGLVGDGAYPLRPGDDGYDAERARIEQNLADDAAWDAAHAAETENDDMTTIPDEDDGRFHDIVITDDSDRSILPDSILFHLEAGGDKAATAELERRAEAELDAEEAAIARGETLPDDDEDADEA